MKMIPIKPITDAPTACKICAGDAPLYGVVDFKRNCQIPGAKRLPLSETPVHYRRCKACGFLFTDAFDDWRDADFKAHIYNADYIAVDPEYAEIRPRANAEVLKKLLASQKQTLRLLDFGGGNDVLCSRLRVDGFSTAVTYDPFVSEFAQAPEGRFDLVTCFETLEHMPNPVAGIGAIIAYLAEPGLVLFSTLVQPPNFDELGLDWWYVGPRNGHVSMFSRNALVLAWQRHGFKTFALADDLHIAFRTLPEFTKLWPGPRMWSGLTSSA